MPDKPTAELTTYRRKRRVADTPEPFSRIHIAPTGALFVVQQHAATHTHFDLRLEVDGVLKSWAVPKGPSNDPKDKRLAVETEDHPLDYADFEGQIPAGNYGAGSVIVWDRGHYRWLGDFSEGYQTGKLLFELHGRKLTGRWTLVRLQGKRNDGRQWLFIKERDAYVGADNAFSDTSILSGLSVKQLPKPGPTVGATRRYIRGLDPPPATQHQVPKPMLATAGAASDRKGWLWELKYDGYRIIAVKDGQSVCLYTRNGQDLAKRFPEVCQVIAHLPVDKFVIDGELVVLDDSGRPNFAMMQSRATHASRTLISRAAVCQPATYYCFDLLEFENYDLRSVTLQARKAGLAKLLPDQSALVYSEHVEDNGRNTFATAKQLGIEGVVGKRCKSLYLPGRSSDWIKVRNHKSHEFVVIGWSPSKTNKADLGSLALAEYRQTPQGAQLSYVGHAGLGLRQAVREDLQKKFRRLARKTCPLAKALKPSLAKPTQWLSAKLVVEVRYTEYTQKGHLRHPSVQRIRLDKTPEECISLFETTDLEASGSVRAIAIKSHPEASTTAITNPEKIYFPEAGYSKADVVTYYRNIARWMLPYLADRPLVLTRYPDGIHGKSFFQRDAPDYVPATLRSARIYSEGSNKEVHYFIVEQPEDLAYLANMGTLPIHMWHSRLQDLNHPDWCVIDLDPKQAPFKSVVKLAKGLAELAAQIDLPAYVKTSGASGLHILLPLSGQLPHAQVRTLGELLAQTLVARYADIATVTRQVRARQNKVYVDYLQNGHGRLLVAPFAVRAEAAASVSMPLRWRELTPSLSNDKYHIGNAVQRMRRIGTDPFMQILQDQPDLARSLARLNEILNKSV